MKRNSIQMKKIPLIRIVAREYSFRCIKTLITIGTCWKIVDDADYITVRTEDFSLFRKLFVSWKSGKTATEDLLDSIFSQFCIGK